MIKVPFSRLSTTNLGTLGTRTVEYSERTANESVTTSPLLAELKAKSEEYNSVVLKKGYSGMGTSVIEADLTRDRVYQNVKRILQGFAGFPETNRGKAALALLKAFDDAGSIHGLSYADETAVLNKIMTALQTDENKANVTVLAMEEEFRQLEESQNNFNQIFFDQVDANAELRKQSSASAIRNELENVLRDYFAYVSAMRRIEPWDDLYQALKELAKAARLSNLPDYNSQPTDSSSPETM